ncbi:hypothetical protein ACYZTL_15525 [Pseudomonas sp. LB3P81]
MTTLISWLGVDQRGPSSIYLASDSRISWGAADAWNYGGKLFIAKSSPEAFGFCGDVLFPLLVIGPICERIDAGGMFFGCRNFYEKLERVRKSVEVSFSDYPTSQRRPFQIFYISRTGQGIACEFHAGRVYSSGSRVVSSEVMEFPGGPVSGFRSGLIRGAGSGSGSIKNWEYRWQQTDVQNTSRSVFGAFCSSLKSGDDSLTGGAPQLVGIYRAGLAKPLGVIWEGKRYLSGVELEDISACEELDWRNEKFEVCDPQTLEVRKGAQKQPIPRKLIT